MLRIIMTGVLFSIVGCGILAGVDEKGTPTGTGILDVAGGVASATIPVYGALAAGVLGYIGVQLRSYLIKKAGRKDDNGNGVPDDAEVKP